MDKQNKHIHILLYYAAACGELSRDQAEEFADLIRSYKGSAVVSGNNIELTITLSEVEDGDRGCVYKLAVGLPAPLRGKRYGFARFIQAVANDYGYDVLVMNKHHHRHVYHHKH